MRLFRRRNRTILSPVPDPKRVYSDDEVRAILSRAIDRQRSASPKGLSHEDLLAVARDAGISPDALEAAAADVTERKEADDDERAIRKERASDFRIHLFTFLPIMLCLAVVNFMTTSYPWVLWPALGWGLALFLHARFAVFPTDVEIAHDAKNRAERRRRKAEKERRKAARNDLKEGAREFGHAVERGVAAMLSDAAKRIHEELDGEPEKPADRVRVEAGTKARVGDDQDEEDEEVDERRARR